MLAPLNIPAGMHRNGTAYANAGRWYDGHLVRWNGGVIRPVGGWKKAASTQMAGVPRAIFPWRENDLEVRAAIGTNSHLYIYSGGSLRDITPAGLTVGRIDSISGFGFGFGVHGGGEYSTGKTPTGDLDAATWSLDSWGEHLVACSSADGKLYEWSNDVTAPAVAIVNAPTGCDGLVVTPERHLVAVGAGGDHRKVQWCDAENNTVWAPLATNSAGSLNVDTYGKLIAGRRVRGQILLWTEQELHTMQYIGSPYYYGITKLATFCGAAGSRAIVEVESGAAWMGHSGFYLFDGSLRPIECDVTDYVFSDFNFEQRAKVTGGHNSRFGEVWWFYPSANSLEVNRYVIWNYRENTWATGNLVRTAWADAGVFQFPLACSADGYVYEQENGWLADGVALGAARFAQCGPVEIGNGDAVMSVRQLLVDEKTAGQVRLSFASRFAPEGTERVYGPYTVRTYTDVRFTGRQVALRIEGVADADWRLGPIRLDAVPGGGR